MDMELVIQGLAARVYTAVIDIVQQIDPVYEMEPHETRGRKLTQAVAEWILTLTHEELTAAHENREYLPFDRWTLTPDETYDDTAVCMAVQVQLFHALDVAEDLHIDGFALVHGVGNYLLDADDHKHGWLAERAANLLVAYMSDEKEGE